MKMTRKHHDGDVPPGCRIVDKDILAYQPDAAEIEGKPVPGRVRWVLYVILGSLVAVVIGAIIFKVDRIVVAEGRLITTAPTIVVQSLSTAVVRSIDVKVGDVVEESQVLVTMDPTFASADLVQLTKKSLSLEVQIRRIEAELQGKSFAAKPDEGEDGRLQELVLHQRRIILERNRQLADDKIAALNAKLAQNAVQRRGVDNQLKLLRDVEGTTAARPQNDNDYRLRLLEAQKGRIQASNSIDDLRAEEAVIRNELKQAESDWRRFVVERQGQLMEQEVQLRGELEKVLEDANKAKRMHELVLLRSPQKGIVLKIAGRSVGSIVQPAEPFVTLVPFDSPIEAEVDVLAKDIGRIRVDDTVRVKLDAFPFQRHGTLSGKVRVISEDVFRRNGQEAKPEAAEDKEAGDAFYRTRIGLLDTELRDVPKGFRLLPGMKARAEIKVGKRPVISYFLYPVIRALDESMREP